MTTYLGLDVLDVTQPNRDGAVQDDLTRRLVSLDYGPGAEWVDEQSAMPNTARPFKWFARSRHEAAAMRAFILARAGRAVPFWMPTYQSDLTLKNLLASGSVAPVVKWSGYTNQMWAKGGARRHLALLTPGGTLECRKVVDAADPGDGVTENLTLDAGASRNYAADTTLVMFLRLCRLDQDANEITWFNPEAAECVLVTREIPMEAPL